MTRLRWVINNRGQANGQERGLQSASPSKHSEALLFRARTETLDRSRRTEGAPNRGLTLATYWPKRRIRAILHPMHRRHLNSSQIARPRLSGRVWAAPVLVFLCLRATG